MANKKITDLMSGTPVRDSLLESAIDISGTMDSRKVKAGAVADLASANVAAPYDETVTYAIGQYCLYEGDIYRCIAITTGAFDSTKWTQIVVTGEYRRVVELTSAQYAQLTPAEQNNGTIYIKTDEETTAADIPYSSGVSVADKLDSLTTADSHSTFGGRTSSSSDITTTSSTTLLTYNINVPKDSVFMANMWATMKTSRFTSKISMYIDGVEKVASSTNQTNFMLNSCSYADSISRGSHTITLVLASQDSGTTATIQAYNSLGLTGIIV